MWNSWVLDKGRELAEQAKKAAEQIEGQLDASVGAPSPAQSSHSGGAMAGVGGGGGAAAASPSSGGLASPFGAGGAAAASSSVSAGGTASEFDDDAFYSHDEDDDEKQREEEMRLARERLEAERAKVVLGKSPLASGQSNAESEEEMQFEGTFTSNGDAGQGDDFFAAAGLAAPSSSSSAPPPSLSPPSLAVGASHALNLVGLAASSSPVAPSSSSPATAVKSASPPASTPLTAPVALATTLFATPPPASAPVPAQSASPVPLPVEEPAPAPTDIEEEDDMDEMYDDDDGGEGWDGDDVDDVDLENEEQPTVVPVAQTEPKAVPRGPEPTVLRPESELVAVEAAAPLDPELEPEPEPESESEPEPLTEENLSEPEQASAPASLSAEASAAPAPVAAASPMPESVSGANLSEEIRRLKEEHDLSLSALQSQLAEAREVLSLREAQVASNSEQLASLQEIHETETADLRSKVRETKDEAKRRILKAKERYDEVAAKLEGAEARIAAAGTDVGGKDEIIAALRSEGEKLAVKQSQMEQRVREARGEARGLAEELEVVTAARTKAEGRAADLEAQLKRTKDELGDARKGETRAGKLGSELTTAREESERKSGQILGLEQQVKELKAANKELKKEMESAKREAAAENERTSSELRRERDDLMSDLESKLRTSEREAAVREDALRHEVGEVRKRWQDAVRRADELSMDAQQSSAPLMRQLESTERQNRARAAAWAELEMKLRSDLEDQIVEVEKLAKERNELRAKVRRLERTTGEKEEELAGATSTIERLNEHIETLEGKVSELEDEGKKIKEEWVEVERRADEGVTKVRTEMMQTVLDSEERYRAQITNLEREVRQERDKRAGMEQRLEDLAETSGMVIQQTRSGESTGGPNSTRARPKKLKSATDQADILQRSLAGLIGGDDDESDVETEGEYEDAAAKAGRGADVGVSAGTGSFAAMEQLSQGLRTAKIELGALRGQLTSSEETRKALLAELAETRGAAEKLPLFEKRVTELSREVQEKDMEIMALREDIEEVRMMYRGQLDALLEEKAMNTPVQIERKVVSDPAEDGAADGTPFVGELPVGDPSGSL